MAKFYSYFLIDENRSGIVTKWEECKKLTDRKKARYKSFSTYEEAQQWLEDGGCYQEKKSINLYLKNSLKDGIYFDAGTGRGIGVEVRVTDKLGNSYFTKKSSKYNVNEFGNIVLKDKTNNYGELLGLYFALHLAKRNNQKNIYGDSNLVIKYWSLGHYNSTLETETIELIKIVSNLRKDFEALGGALTWISGDINPADLGFHK